MEERKQNSTGKKKGSTITDNLFDLINPDNVLGNAQRVISSAVNILEEEIAAGIVAAKRIEKKVIDTESLKSNPDDLMNRIRRDTHEAVDLFLDAFAALSKQVGLLNTTLAKTETNASPATAKTTNTTNAANVFSVIAGDHPAKAGEVINLHMSICDPAAKKIIKVQLNKNDLTGTGFQKILCKNIALKPAAFDLRPGEEKEVLIQVKVPATALPGKYCSLISDATNTSIKTVFEIEVTA